MVKTSTTQPVPAPVVPTVAAAVVPPVTTPIAPPETEKKYECAQCQRPFQNHFQLNRHMR